MLPRLLFEWVNRISTFATAAITFSDFFSLLLIYFLFNFLIFLYFYFIHNLRSSHCKAQRKNNKIKLQKNICISTVSPSTSQGCLFYRWRERLCLCSGYTTTTMSMAIIMMSYYLVLIYNFLRFFILHFKIMFNTAQAVYFQF